MISDYNLKAVVFDDREEEAKPLIDALNYERVPNIFINFKDDDRGESKKLQNIRIVFADLIVGEYASGDDNAIIEAIRASILDNISVDNGPFILVGWSKNTKLVNLLQERILEIEPKLNFLTVELDKHEYFTKIDESKDYKIKDGVTFKNISMDIVTKLKEMDYLEVFLEWEKDARTAISKVLNEFLSNIDDKEMVSKNISATIKSTIGGQRNLSEKDKINAFYKTMNGVLSDSIENNVAPDNKYDPYLSCLSLEKLDADTKAKFNTKTLFDEIKGQDKTLKNGNIYSYNEFRNIFYGDVIQDICNDNNKIKEIFLYKKKECKKIMDEANITEESCFKEISNYSIPILFEFTPSCDIANNKLEKSRLIFGYLIDSKYTCLNEKNESLYFTSFHFHLKNDSLALDSNYRIVLLIKSIFAVNPNKVKKMKPIIRARKELVTDLQHTIASHVSRIGISSIDGFD